MFYASSISNAIASTHKTGAAISLFALQFVSQKSSFIFWRIERGSEDDTCPMTVPKEGSYRSSAACVLMNRADICSECRSLRSLHNR